MEEAVLVADSVGRASLPRLSGIEALLVVGRRVRQKGALFTVVFLCSLETFVI